LWSSTKLTFRKLELDRNCGSVSFMLEIFFGFSASKIVYTAPEEEGVSKVFIFF
jgi:hypothetical protein